MKKIIVGGIVFGLTVLFSCKSEKENDFKTEVNIGQDSINSDQSKSLEVTTEKEIVFPTFESKTATDFAKKYNDYVVELKLAAGEDQEKLSELTFKAVDLEKEFQKTLESLSKDDNKKLTDFINEQKQSVQ